jgi:hypothetical protein
VKKTMMQRECPNELDWSAFCYAAGEMSPADAEAFEARLATDQTAREALARAVELTETVATAESLGAVVAVRQRPAVWSRRLGWMAVGSAASLLIALLWSGAQGTNEPKPASPDHSQLAAAWTQTRAELAENESDLWYGKHLAASELVDPVITGQDERAGDLLESVTPDWLTAAVETYPGEPTDADETPFDGERREN